MTISPKEAVTLFLEGKGQTACLRTFAGATETTQQVSNGDYIYLWDRLENTVARVNVEAITQENANVNDETWGEV